MAVRVQWTPSTDPVDSYKLSSGSSSSGSFSLLATVAHDLTGSNYDTTTGFFFYDHTAGTTATWYQLVATYQGVDSSPSPAFQAGTTTLTTLTTVGRLKEYLGIASSTDDVLLARLVNAASDWFQTQVGRSILRNVYVESHDGDGGRRLQLLRGPLVEVSSVSVNDVAIPARPSTTGAGYTVRGQSVFLTNDYTFTSGLMNVVVTYEAGFLTVPADVEQAVLEMAAMRYRERTRIGVMSNSVGGESVSYQTVTVPVSVQSVVDSYKRMPTIG